MRKSNVTILGVGSYLPANIVNNIDLCENIETTPEWVEEKLGIVDRRFAFDEGVADLTFQASLAALKDSGVDKEELDLIMVVTSSPDQLSPSVACVLHSMLEVKKSTPSFDINAVCSGFVYAISLASNLIGSGAYKKILIAASETYSKHTSEYDRNCVFFGDGAGAVVLGASKNGWMVSEISANGSGTGMTGFSMPLSGPFKMNGREVWDAAVEVLPASIETVVNESGLEISDIKMMIPHQPSANMLKYIAEKVGLPVDKVKMVQHKYGNIAGASIPIALDDALKNKEINKGDKLILSAVGSGWTWGTVVINYDD